VNNAGMKTNASFPAAMNTDNKRWKAVVEVVIPAKNEASMIDEVLRNVKEYADIIVVVDGHSGDETRAIVQKNEVEMINQRGLGKGGALREAFDRVKGDIIIMMDSDGSMRPKEIPGFIDAIESGADVVKGSRFLGEGHSEDMTVIRKIGNLFFLFLVNKIWSTRYTDLCYGFKAFTRDSIERLRPYLNSTQFDIETEICIKSKKLGLKVVEIPSFERKRIHGNSNLNTVLDGARILRRILKEAVRKSPVRSY
jgi:glycosyltransferase involved in cell wall biosynthesis